MDPDARGRNMRIREEIELPVDILVVAQAIGEVDPARSDDLREIADAVGALMRALASSCPGRRAAAEADELRAALAIVKAERDRLISACVWEFRWRPSPRGELRHEWRWVVGDRSGIEGTEELARAAVRAAAGISDG